MSNANPEAKVYIEVSPDLGESWYRAPLGEISTRLTVTAFVKIRSLESDSARKYKSDALNFIRPMLERGLPETALIRVVDGYVALTAPVRTWRTMAEEAGNMQAISLVSHKKEGGETVNRKLATAEEIGNVFGKMVEAFK
jgi:hypothetical protein